jgi:hypothetical protein
MRFFGKRGGKRRLSCWKYIGIVFNLVWRAFTSQRALKLIASHDLQHFGGNDQCDHCQSPKKMFKHIPEDMQRLPCLGVMGRPCVLCTLLRSGCSFTGRAGGSKVAPVYANATNRSHRDEECTDIVRERQETAVSAPRFTEAVDKRELEDIVEVIEVPSQSPSPLLVAAEPAKMYKAAEMTQPTRTEQPAEANKQAGTTKLTKTDKPAEANKQAKTDMSVTITPSISPDTLCTSLEDIQRYRRALWRKTVSTATFLMKVQPDIHSTGGITIDEVPDLMKEMIEEVDALKSMANGIIDEVNEYQRFVGSAREIGFGLILADGARYRTVACEVETRFRRLPKSENTDMHTSWSN